MKISLIFNVRKTLYPCLNSLKGLSAAMANSNSGKKIRWAFNFWDWTPTKDQWISGLSFIQPEERTKVNRFMFTKDAKSTLIGRLMIRKVVSSACGVPYKSICLKRSTKGKPYVVLEDGSELSVKFNVSHAGKYTVLAAQPADLLGTDIMQIAVRGRNKSTDEYVDIFQKSFSDREWSYLKESGADQLTRFHRLWCLKESYVKAIGTGISTGLSRLDFDVRPPDVSADSIVTDTSLRFDGSDVTGWRFEELMLDSEHVVATAVCPDDDGDEPAPVFRRLTWAELTKGAEPLDDVDLEDMWTSFAAKPLDPRTRT